MKTPAAKKPVSHVPALERGLKILEWMAGREEAATLTQIARGMDLGIPEVQRPVACLEESGYLRHLSTGAYVLSGKLFSVASHHPPQHRLRRAAEPAMIAFAAQTGQSVHLSLPDGDSALMILDVPGEGLVRLSLRSGARFHPKDTVSGALLASVGAIAKPKGFRTPAALKRSIREAQPFSRESRQVEGVLDVGILIRDTEQRVLGVLTASVITPRNGDVNLPALSAALMKAAGRLTETV